jgi:chromosome segregation ATPase
MRVALAIVLGTVALAVAAGCGGDSPPTRGQYAAEGNEICRETREEVNAVPQAQPPSLEDLREKTPAARKRVREWAEYSTKLDEIGRRAQDRLLELEPPEDLQAQHDQLEKNIAALDRAGKEANEAGQKLRDAARSGTKAQVRQATAASRKAAQRQATIADRIRRDVSALGWTVCARRS